MSSKFLYCNIRAQGCTPPDGKPLIVVTQNGKELFAPLELFTARPAKAFELLTRQGLIIGGAGQAAQLTEQVRDVTFFPKKEVLTASGWNGPLFARPDGKVLVPRTAEGCKVPGVAFHRTSTRFRRAGSWSTWHDDLAPAVVKDEFLALLAGVLFGAAVRPLMSAPVPATVLEVVARVQTHSKPERQGGSEGDA